MCGIFGLYSGTSPLPPRIAEQSLTRIRHRGPDDEGYFFYNTGDKTFQIAAGTDTPEPVLTSNFPYSPHQSIEQLSFSANLVLGNRRLSILDLSPAGHQPMCSPEKSLWITYNGEIYNYIELRDALLKKGYRFQTETDTEVLLFAYQEWGEDFVNRLNGMWAFAIADLKRELLFCSRDRTGVKPFYYRYEDGSFAFGSEIKSILDLPNFETKPNDNMIWDYFVLNQVNHTEETFYQGIYSLPPGHNLIIVFEGGLALKRYWSIPSSFDPIKREEAADKLRDLLTDAVNLRLRSDVPVGSCLSGGLDSSSIVLLSHVQKTFTAIFEDDRLNDREFVAGIVQQAGCDPNEAFPNADELWTDAEKLVYYQDEPFLSSSIYAQYSLMKKVKAADVKVLLDGQGGDELLAGYYSYYYPYWADLLKEKKFGRFFREFRLTSKRTQMGRWRSRFLLLKELFRRLSFSQPYYSSRLINVHEPYLHSTFLNQYRQRAADWLSNRSKLNLNERLVHDLTHDKLPALLRYEDRNSMAFSIEARVPFADDYRILEFVGSLPIEFKIHDGQTKALLREAMKGTLPENIRLRTDKKGFDTPEAAWLRKLQKPMKEFILQENDPYTDTNNLPPNLWKIFCFKRWWSGLKNRSRS